MDIVAAVTPTPQYNDIFRDYERFYKLTDRDYHYRYLKDRPLASLPEDFHARHQILSRAVREYKMKIQEAIRQQLAMKKEGAAMIAKASQQKPQTAELHKNIKQMQAFLKALPGGNHEQEKKLYTKYRTELQLAMLYR